MKIENIRALKKCCYYLFVIALERFLKKLSLQFSFPNLFNAFRQRLHETGSVWNRHEIGTDKH